MLDKLVTFILDSIKLFRLYVIVREFERGVILRWGKFKRVAEPGRVWVIPFGVDAVYESPNFIQTMIIGPQSLITKCGREIVVSTLVTHQVTDHQKFICLIQGGEQAIEDIGYGVVAKLVMSKTWEELTSEDLPKELTTRMRQRTDDYGVNVKSAQIIDFTKSKSIRLISHGSNRLIGASVA